MSFLRHATQLAGALVLIALLVLTLAFFSVGSRQVLTNPIQLRQWVAQWGVWAPVGIILLQAMQVVLAPIPGQVVGLASGYLFGTFWGSLYSIVGTVLGSWIVFGLARTFGRPLVERFLPSASLERLDQGMRKRGLSFLMVVFLMPFVPDDAACFVAGLTSIPIPALMLAALMGRTPSLIVSAWLGASATGLSTVQWTAAISITLVFGLIFVRYADRLQTTVMSWAEKWSSKTQT